MTKEITKAWIIKQMEDKLALRDLIPEVFSFSETVVPVYDIERHLEEPWCKMQHVSVTSTATYEFFVVPDNERWTLRGYNVVFMAAGAYKVSGVYILRVNRDPTATSTICYLDLTEGQTVSYANNLACPVVLEPRSRLYILVDDYTSTAELRLYIDYIREVIS